MADIDPWRSGLAVVVLLAITLLTARWAGVRMKADTLVAVSRAIVQLVLVALVIAWVFRHPEGAVVYLGIMLVAATATSVRRIGCAATLAPAIGVSIALGALAASGAVLGSGALEWRAQTILPFSAQIIGGSMTAASLAGARLRDEVEREWDQVEAWLSIGATPRQAVADLGRVAVGRALFPAIDQTRSAGLVTLPGAFVGLLLGGATPAQAAELQVLVLVGLLAAQTISSALTVRVLASSFGTVRPDPVE